jgi:hypothetical protein
LIPSISFLVHISPSAYLQLVRKATNQKPPTTDFPLDITLADIKKNLASIHEGVTIATLHLQELSGSGIQHLYPGSMSIPHVSSRPTFFLSPAASEFDHVFPQINTDGASINPPGLNSSSESAEAQYRWMLDFTRGGTRRGVVVSQSRMKAIELVVNPLAVGSSDAVAGGSWIDLLVSCVGFFSTCLDLRAPFS